MSKVLVKTKVRKKQTHEQHSPTAKEVVAIMPSRMKPPELKVKKPERIVPKCNCCGRDDIFIWNTPMAGWLCPGCARDGGYM